MSELFSRGLAELRARVAHDYGCRVEDFDTHGLTVVQRPGDAREKTLASIVTFGTGTVVSADASFIELVRGLTFEKHFLAFGPLELALPVIEEARRRGIEVIARNPGLGFVLSREPAMPEAPEGMRFERWDLEQCRPWTTTFHNALWDDPSELDQFLYALVLVNEDGRPMAMTGAWREGDHLVEIGIDVLREARGLGLAPVITQAIARTILDSGKLPTYYCATTNILSHRNAERSGFTPVLSASVVRPKKKPVEAG
jgi:GNAT acetyltransferase-like protein